MRIAFLGKGGSGKTTLSSLVIRLAPEYFKEVFAVDADINMHLSGALHFNQKQKLNFTDVFKYYDSQIRSNRPELSELKSLPRTLPPWNESSKIGIDIADSIWSKSGSQNQTVLTELGSYNENNMGWSCHHSSLGKLQLVLSHTKDNPDQLIVADLTAGADVFGVGMLGLFDKIFVAVEPTIKSTDIYNQLTDLAAHDDVELIPVANKIIDQTDIDFIKSKIGFEPIYKIEMSNFVRRLERDDSVTNDDIEESTKQTIGRLLSHVKSHKRDEASIKKSYLKAHRRAAQNWPKNKFEIDLLDLINPDEENDLK